MTPVGRKDLERPPLFVGDSVRLVEQGAIETLRIDPRSDPRTFEPGVPRHQRRLVASIPIDGVGAGLRQQGRENRTCITTRDDQPRPAFAQRAVERTEGLVQPPA